MKVLTDEATSPMSVSGCENTLSEADNNILKIIENVTTDSHIDDNNVSVKCAKDIVDKISFSMDNEKNGIGNTAVKGSQAALSNLCDLDVSPSIVSNINKENKSSKLANSELGQSHDKTAAFNFTENSVNDLGVNVLNETSKMFNGCVSHFNTSEIADPDAECQSIENNIDLANRFDEIKCMKSQDSLSKSNLVQDSSKLNEYVFYSSSDNSSIKRSASKEWVDSDHKRIKTQSKPIKGQLASDLKHEDDISTPGISINSDPGLAGESSDFEKKKVTNPNKLYQGLLNDVLAEEQDVINEPEIIRSKLKRIKRKDLEDMIIDQVVNKLLYDHELDYQKEVCKKMDKTMEESNSRVLKLTQEIESLRSIVNKVNSEHRKRRTNLVYPTKVKRSVGIQANKSYISQGFSAAYLPDSDVRLLTPTKYQRVKKDSYPTKKSVVTSRKHTKLKPKENNTKPNTARKSEDSYDLGKDLNQKLNSLKEDIKNSCLRDKIPPTASMKKHKPEKNNVLNGKVVKECFSPSKNLNLFPKPDIPEPRHPAPLPSCVFGEEDVLMNRIPPEPILRVHLRSRSIILSWNISLPYDEESILSYQLFSYEETTCSPSTDSWQKIGSVKALELPMACTLTQFKCGRVYHFAVRATTKRGRLGPFSQAKSLRMPPK